MLQHRGIILGLNSAYHEPSACLMVNGRIMAAAEKERFNRVRHGKPADLTNPHWLPVQAIQYCLEEAGITPEQIDLVGYSFDPAKRMKVDAGGEVGSLPFGAGTPEGEELFIKMMETVPLALSQALGVDLRAKFRWIEHHRCHAASAYYPSPFTRAAVMSVDGIGESTCTWMGRGNGANLECLREIAYPHSVGLLWTKLCRFLGFGEYGQSKVMALAGYGDASRFYAALRSFIRFDGEGEFALDNGVLQIRAPGFESLAPLLGPPRNPGEILEDSHRDLAASLQRVTNEILLGLAKALHGMTAEKSLCLAGGVALNCVTNQYLLDHGPFREIFIQPAANDAGTAMGACYHLWHQVMHNPRTARPKNTFLGPAPTRAELQSVSSDALAMSREGLWDRVADLLAKGDLVALFQGRMEFGPRALGHRSILGDPRRPDLAHRINDQVKNREPFRPFGASVLRDKAPQWFDLSKPSPSDAFMLFARRLRSEKMGLIPAVTHVDGTSRIQTVTAKDDAVLHRVLELFEERTGVPMLLNTSLNDREPIVRTPQEAFLTCTRAGVRYLVLGGNLLDLRPSAGAAESVPTEDPLTLFAGRLHTDLAFRQAALLSPESVLQALALSKPEELAAAWTILAQYKVSPSLRLAGGSITPGVLGTPVVQAFRSR